MLIALVAALAVAPIPITPPGVLPGWTPDAQNYGPRLVELLQRGVDAAPEEYQRLTEAEKKCWWATQMYELLTADYMATGLRLAVSHRIRPGLARPSAGATSRPAGSSTAGTPSTWRRKSTRR